MTYLWNCVSTWTEFVSRHPSRPRLSLCTHIIVVFLWNTTQKRVKFQALQLFSPYCHNYTCDQALTPQWYIWVLETNNEDCLVNTGTSWVFLLLWITRVSFQIRMIIHCDRLYSLPHFIFLSSVTNISIINTYGLALI